MPPQSKNTIRRRGLSLTLAAALVPLGCAAADPGPPPPGLVFATFLGGSRDDSVRDIAVGPGGQLVVVGGSESPDFPTTEGAVGRELQTGNGRPHDVMVASYGAEGHLQWATLVGGPAYDRAYAVEVDAEGSVYVAGRAGPGFPTTEDAAQPDFAGDEEPNGAYGPQDGFVAKLAGDGGALIWSTYLGGGGRAFVRDIAIDASGAVYAAMSGVGPDFPHYSADAYASPHRGGSDGAVVKLAPGGSSVEWGAIVGGSDTEWMSPSVRVASGGDVFVLGVTRSADYPTTPGAFGQSFGGGADLVVSKLSSDGGRLLASTYLGGSESEFTETHGLALGADGSVFVAGTTLSQDLPTTPGAFQAAFGGAGGFGTGRASNYSGDLLVARLDASDLSLQALTYLGGAEGEGVEGVEVTPWGTLALSGATYSRDFPAESGRARGDADCFLVELDLNLSAAPRALRFGGARIDLCRALAAGAGRIAVAGASNSLDFPLTAAGQAPAGGRDGDGLILSFRAPGREAKAEPSP